MTYLFLNHMLSNLDGLITTTLSQPETVANVSSALSPE